MLHGVSRLLVGSYLVGLFLYLLLEWQAAQQGLAVVVFLSVYFISCFLLLKERLPQRIVPFVGLTGYGGVLGCHFLFLAGHAILLYLPLGVFLAWRLQSRWQVVVSGFLLGASYVALEWRNLPDGHPERAGWIVTSGLWLLLLVILIHQIWVQKQRFQELQQVLEKRADETRRHVRRYIQEFEKLSIRDDLTGLYNLRGFQHFLRQNIHTSSQIHLFLLDVVSFSEFNAYMGREAGDNLLRQIAAGLQEKMPADSLLSRYDGDKFAVAILGERQDPAVEEKIRHLIHQVVMAAGPGQHRLRYCVGMAAYPQDGNSWQELINVAERRLTQEQRSFSYRLEAVRIRRERLSTIGQLAAGLAHEIRNPLTSVRGFVQLAAEQVAEMNRWKNIILPEIDRIDALLSRLLEIADHQSKRPQLVSVNQVVDETLELMQSEAVMRGCQLRGILPDKPIYAWLERRQIQQVLVQLIQYGMAAVEEQPEPCVEVTLDEQDEMVILTIRVNGAGSPVGGMADETQDMFAMMDYGGLKDDLYGFGLSLIQQIVSEHGGQLYIQSQPLCGHEVTLFLPKEGESEREAESVGESERGACSVARKTSDSVQYGEER